MTDQPQEPKEKSQEEKNMSFLDHLAELRKVLVRSILVIFLCALPFLIFYKQALRIFQRLLPSDATLVVLGPIELYIAIVKVSLFCSLFISLPYVLYQIWWFVGPGLYRKEKQVVLPFVFSGWCCFIVGVVFCYLVVLPFCLNVLWTMGNIDYSPSPEKVYQLDPNIDIVKPSPQAIPNENAVAESPKGSKIMSQWNASTFFNFCLWTSFGFGVGFNLPVVLVGLAMMGIISAAGLAKVRAYALVVCFIVGAVLTPSDPFSMFLLAVPLYLLYESSIITIKIIDRRRKNREGITSA